jgi:hypothetical protein
MNDGRSKRPDWQVLLQDVVLESDRVRLAAKVESLETLIFERLQEPSPLSDDPSEQEVLVQAVSALRNIKRDRLGFPDWK